MLTTEWGPVGTRGGCGAGWRPCASWWQRAPLGTLWSKQVAPQPGQAQGPLIHSTPPLVPTGPGTQASQWIGFPDSVVNIHQGWTLLVMRHCHVQIEPCLRDDGHQRAIRSKAS